MKHTKEQIGSNALKALVDIKVPFNEKKGIYNIYFEDKEKPLRGSYAGQLIPAWTVAVEFEIFSEKHSLFITIPDETGEPIYIQHDHAVIELEKDDKGIYHKKLI